MRRTGTLVVALVLLVTGCSSGGASDAPATTNRVTPCATDRVALPSGVTQAAWRRGTAGADLGLSVGGSMPFDPQADIRRELDLAASSGVRWMRIDVDWSYIESHPGTFSWCRTDAVIAGARARGIDVLGILTYAPGWASGGSSHAAPRDPQDFAAFARAAVERYEPIGVHSWEVWNEPNLDAFWQPKPDVHAYVQLLRAAASAIRGADAGATVVAGALAVAKDAGDGSTIAPLTFLDGMYDAGAAGTFDALSLHPYTFPEAPPGHDTLFADLADAHAAMVANGDGHKPIWLTEFGAPTGTAGAAVTERAQAAAVTQAYDAASAHPWVGPLFWFQLRDEGSDPADLGQNFGLVRRDLSPKPAFPALEHLAREPAA